MVKVACSEIGTAASALLIGQLLFASAARPSKVSAVIPATDAVVTRSIWRTSITAPAECK